MLNSMDCDLVARAQCGALLNIDESQRLAEIVQNLQGQLVTKDAVIATLENDLDDINAEFMSTPLPEAPKPQKHIYALNAGAPHVIAESQEEAHRLICDASDPFIDIALIDKMDGAEMFTVLYTDPFEDDPVLADAAPCEFGCEDFHNHTTMSFADWAECGWGLDGPVIWEFEG